MLQALDIARVRSKGLAARETGIVNIWSPILRVLGPGRDATTLTIDDISIYEGRRRAETFRGETTRGQTIRREVQAIRRGIMLAKKTKLMAKDPIDWTQVDKVKSDPPSPTKSGKLWAADEIAKVLACLSPKAVTVGVRDRMRLIQLTGLRAEELARVRGDWVRNGVLYVPHAGSKTREPRMIPVSKEAADIITKWGSFEHCSPNKPLKLASKRAGFAVVLTPRDLRVFYITHAGRHNLAAARDLAGHTNIATTSRYLKSDFRSVLEAAEAAQKASEAATRRWAQQKKARQNG
jgi:integrase